MKVEFTHEGTKFLVFPSNVSRYRQALEKPKKHKPEAFKPIRRYYPTFREGMSTAEYVQQYQRQFETVQIKIEHSCINYHKNAPMFDASVPEVIEEIDSDYVEPVKRKNVTSAQLRKACQAALYLLMDPDADADDANKVIELLKGVL